MEKRKLDRFLKEVVSNLNLLLAMAFSGIIFIIIVDAHAQCVARRRLRRNVTHMRL